jgi:transposase
MAPKKKFGRPSKLTEARQKEIVTAIQAGATYEIAATYAGISYVTFNNWMQQGRTEYERLEKATAEYDEKTMFLPAAERKQFPMPEPLPEKHAYLDFFNAVSEANAVAAVGWLQVIDTRAQQDPAWAAWMLQHRYPRDYAGRSVEVGASGGENSNEVIVRITYADPNPPAQVIDAAAEYHAAETPYEPGSD